MKIGVVGNGVVGNATARCFMEYAEVRVWDIVKEKTTHPLKEVLDCNLIFICLPTPMKVGSHAADTSAIESFFRDVAQDEPYRCYVLKSTVPIGTTRLLRERYNLANLVHSPEFLTARCAITDAQIPARNIIGGTGGSVGCRTEADLYDLYRLRFPGVPIHWMTSDESEAVKLIVNGFFAVKLAYFNEMWTLADKHSLDWDVVMAGILSDGRIAHAHTKVPGPHGFGFSGACLPKDIASIVAQLEEAGLLAAVTRAAMERNQLDLQRE